MPPHTCIPPPLAELLHVISHSNSEDEVVDTIGLEARCARGDRIIFQTPSMVQVTPELTRAEGKKPLIQKIKTSFLPSFSVWWKIPVHWRKSRIKICVTKGKVSDLLLDTSLSSPPPPSTTSSQSNSSTSSSPSPLMLERLHQPDVLSEFSRLFDTPPTFFHLSHLVEVLSSHEL